jgi:hypothetical protein
MALVKGTNSYATVAEADAYFSDSFNKIAWTAASSTSKAQALVTATSIIDEYQFTGMAVSDTQTLAFPRYGSYFDPKVGAEVVFDEVEVPTRIINAVYELAHHLLLSPGSLDTTSSVKSLSVGSISLTDIRSPERVPSTVTRLINPLLTNAGGGAMNAWWRAN